ncbi:aspartate dehydrogenase [Rhizobium bangladeshense]|uniref:aspartate dehydrogenase n=1 Tax=Rhizobium bangladeshense TaxID=1138189 RepID=UPI001A991D1C|nr:aspartate dehydrogenase [Rhizobium bangladeshense]MBX4892963.1 aspartate dehydrogenase [Rhizobium bangladeshense]MBX4917356.1 aspartate dehydrogenase [Rhizobium bangladeshense]QSY97474.1 aspartate dehydrogenase [Rhizobium bangladeshense]
MRATTHVQKPLRLGFIGWGAINRRVAELLRERQGHRIAFSVVCLKDVVDVGDVPAGAKIITCPSELLDIELDFMIEAAGRGAVTEWGEAALQQSQVFVVASASAFCDDALLQRLTAVAEDNGAQLLVPPGALAGVDAIAAASVLSLNEVIHRIVKPPAAWRSTEAEQLVVLGNLRRSTTFFSGSARDAAARFPQNANVAAITALSGIGLDRTHVELVADPDAKGNRHELVARGDFGKLSVSIENRPLATNPKSSEMAALSLVRLVENRVLAFAR